jgi:hypothetical protein
MSQLRKTIVIPFSTFDKTDEVIINVSWDILEKVERIYSTSAEYVASQIFPNIAHVQRHKIAQILAVWSQGLTKLKQVEIHEAVQTCSQEQLYRYIGMIQAAILWSVRNGKGMPLISDKQFDALVNGEDIDLDENEQDQEEQKPEDAIKPKKPRAATSKKRTA